MSYEYLMQLFSIFYSFNWGSITLGFLTTAFFAVLTAMGVFLIPRIINNWFN